MFNLLMHYRWIYCKKKIAILWVVKNVNNWVNLYELFNNKETIAYDVKVIYFKSLLDKGLWTTLYLLIVILCSLFKIKTLSVNIRSIIKWLFMSLD